jgi:spore coat polysaccharide biosynthesis predicted glycosyltransferase SpsG
MQKVNRPFVLKSATTKTLTNDKPPISKTIHDTYDVISKPKITSNTNDESSTPKLVPDTSFDILSITDDNLLKDSSESQIPIIVEDKNINSPHLPLVDINQNQIHTNVTNQNINGMFQK